MKELNNFEQENAVKPKKFVFQLDPENAKYIQYLTANQRNSLINKLVNNHITHSYNEKLDQNFIKPFKQLGVAIIAIIITVPLFIMLLNFSLNLTKSSYSDMQKNFEKLFEERGITK